MSRESTGRAARSWQQRVAIALAIYAAATLLRLAALPVEAGVPFLTYYPAAVVAFYLCGSGPGALFVVLGAATGYYVFTPPYWSLTPTRTSVLALLFYLAACLLIGWIITRMEQSSRRLQAALAELATTDKRLRSVVEELDDLYDQAPTGFYSLDTNGRFLKINDTALRWLGREREGLLGQLGPCDFFTAESREKFARSFPLFKQSGRVEGLGFDLLAADGSVRHVSVTATAIYDAHGAYLRSRSVVHDITELRIAQDRLQQLATEQAAMLNNSLIGIVKLLDRRAVWVNDAMLRLFGYAQAELLGQSSRLLYPDEAAFLGFGASAYADLSAGRRHHAQIRMLRKDGQALWIDAHGQLLSAETGASIWFLADITAIRAAHDETERAQRKAEETTRAKSAFLANMSHEIRTPMNAIIGLAHLMLRETRDATARERLGHINDAARHLLQVISDILDLSKIEAGKLTLEEVDFPLDAMLDNAFQMIRIKAVEKGLELVLDTDHLPRRMRGDPTRLSQALINLLGNAVKFTERGWIRVRGELIAQDRDDITLRFEVRDTGEGVPADRQAALFNAFEQADSSTTRRHGGTGLGLALTRHLATIMGGETGMTSEPGVGSCFWFTARLKRAAEAGDLAAPVPLQGLRALLVDDLPQALQALAERLRMLGLHVDTRPDGHSALALAATEIAAGRAFDVMMIDWRMAPLDGIETWRRMRALLGDGAPPAILVTAFDDPQMWAQARKVQYDAVLLKPITASALQDTLMKILRRQSSGKAVPPAAEDDLESALRRDHPGQRILLAEDNRLNRDVVRDLLGATGLVVEIAEDGRRAVELASTRHYDLILMDMQMPSMNGLEATHAIRRQCGAGIPIIALTANAFAEDRRACLEAGMNDHLAKPLSTDLLFKALLRWLPLDAPAATHQDPPAAAGASGRSLLPIRERVAGVDGFDYDEVLRNLGGRPAAVEGVLRDFSETYRPGVPAWLVIERDDGIANGLQACHSVRGSYALFGCAGLLDELVAFERALRAPQDLAELASQGRRLHERVRSLAGELAAAL